MRRITALALAAIACVSLGACQRTTSRPAATVNGVDIPTKALVDEINSIAANDDYVKTLNGTINGKTPGSYDAAFVAQVLVQQINYSMVHQEFVRENLQPSDACKNQARNELFVRLGGQNQDANAGEQLFNKFDQKYQDLLVQRNTELLALEYSLSGEQCGGAIDPQSYYNSHPADFTKLCISLIAVADQATADSLVAQARAGADFATLARNNSIDDTTKANGGDLGCQLPSTFNQDVADKLEAAQTGEVLDPIPGQNGFSIVKVTDRQLATLDEVSQQVEELATLDLGKAFTNWLNQARTQANVTVDSRYGTFDKQQFTINPPPLDGSSGPDTTSTTTPSSSFSSSPSTDAP